MPDSENGKSVALLKNRTKKMGHFKKLARDQFFNRKGTENEILRLWGISKN